MISRYEVWYNDAPLSGVDPDILITDVAYAPARINFETFTTAKRNGARIHRQYVGESSCTVSFQIRKYGIADRQDVCGKVIRWAKGRGVLRTNDRVGQRLRCVCKQPPNIASVLRWTDTLQITFTAYALPFWEEIQPATILLSGITDEVFEMHDTMDVPGNVDGSLIEAHVTVGSSSTLDYLTLSANDRTMRLRGLDLENNSTIDLTYDDDMIQSIVASNKGVEEPVSILNKRSGPDDLLGLGGEENRFAYSTLWTDGDRPIHSAFVDVQFMVRGLWL